MSNVSARPPATIYEQFDGGMKEFAIYSLELLFDTGQVSPLADVLVAQTAHGEYENGVEYWYFYSAGIDQLQDAAAIRINSDQYDWDQFESVWESEVEGRLTVASMMPATVQYAAESKEGVSTVEVPASMSHQERAPLSCGCFEHADTHRRAQVRLELTKDGERCIGSMTWLRDDPSDGPLVTPTGTLVFNRASENGTPVSWRSWRGLLG